MNNPIKKSREDVIGFNEQIKTIQCAIKNGANMIGIIADYGSGKSSMVEMLTSSKQNIINRKPIKINMWDCLRDITNTKDATNNVSILTKSFLYQLSNGYSTKLGKYVNKILSKNYGTIALAINNSFHFWMWFVVAGIFYTIYQIANISNTGIMKYFPDCYDFIASALKLGAPIFIFITVICMLIGLKDAYIAFSHWNMSYRREPEINDVFDTYNIIVKKIKPFKCRKQLIFVDDLDRINNKELIVDFLKELYRFQESLGKYKNRFVFIISIRPESELEKDKEHKKSDEVYSKIFDLTLSLKPIHFDDYDSILLKLLENNLKEKKKLEKLIGQKIQDVLPESFRWIKKGTNLNLRDLKDRLNQAISIMISLKNKNYKIETAVNFESCTAVAYLENKYPHDYYNLIKLENELAYFIQNSAQIIDRNGKNKLEEVKTTFSESFVEEKIKVTFDKNFINDLCEMVLGNLFNDDFRMYFYTYPKGSHIKTTDERVLCDYILFPNSYADYDNLDETVKKAFESGDNLIVKQTLESLESFPPVVIENDTLFLLAAKLSIKKTFLAFAKKAIDSEIDEGYKANYWKRILVLSKKDYNEFVSISINDIAGPLSEPDFIITNRKTIIKGIGNRITDFKELYISSAHKTPQITKEEIELINNLDISLQLVDINNLKEEHYAYLIPAINSKVLYGINNTFECAVKIWHKLSSFFPPENIGEDLLKFLSVNQFVDENLFSVVSISEVESWKIAEYLNKTLNGTFSDNHLQMIDDLGFENDISEDRVIELLTNGFYFTPLLYCANNNCLSKIDGYISNVTEILEACERINEINEDEIVKIREYLYLKKKIEEYKVLYHAPYPLITNHEYVSTTEVDLIDVSQIEEDNYEDVVNVIHNKKYSSEELISLIKWIFDENTNEECLEDSSLRKDLFDSLNFKLLGIKNLYEEQRNAVYSLLEQEFAIESGEDAIESLKRIGCLIPTVEAIIQNENSLNKEYCNLISSLDEMTTTSIDWCWDNYVTCGLSPYLCEILYKNEDYQNYIIGETLRQNYMIINENVSFDNYIKVYIKVSEMFDIMSEHHDFLEKLQEEADFNELSSEQIEAMIYFRQSERFFNYIFSDETDDSLKIKYLKNFGSFKEEKDSKAFQKLICQEKNMELLDSWDLYHRIHNLLWSTHPGHKGAFTKAWNKRWKEELS